MHVKVPETVYVAAFQEASANFDGMTLCPWLYPTAETVIVNDDAALYFREHRRKDFSDVCHAKVDKPLKEGLPYAFPGVLPVAMQPSSLNYHIFGDTYREKTGTATAFTGSHLSSNGRVGVKVSMGLTRTGGLNYRFRPQCMVCRLTGTDITKNVLPATYMLTFGSTVYVNAASQTWQETTDPRDSDMGLDEYFISMAKTCPLDILNYPTNPGPIMQWVHDSTEALYRRVLSWLEENPSFQKRTARVAKYSVVEPDKPTNLFLLHEPEAVMDKVDDVLLGRGFENYFRNVLTQHAYLDAINHVPRMSDNNISNLLEIISFIKSLVIDRKIEVPGSLSDLWMAYRYSYGTTKLDVEEAIEFMHRQVQLGEWSSIKSYGRHTINYEGVDITCRCEFDVMPKVLATVQKLWRTLYTYGLSPNFYVVWDMIPYSFIVDWFLPIGDVMAAWDAEREFPQYFDIENINFSLSYKRKVGSNIISCYTRWLSTTPIPLRGYYFLESNSASDNTIIKRALDTASLIMG